MQKKNTLHRIVGAISINAYISQNANRANYPARIGPESIEPLTLRDQLAAVNAELVNSAMVAKDKLAFVTRLYILQNWDEVFVRSVPGDKVDFAREVLQLQHVSEDNMLLPLDVVPCCTIETIEVSTTARLRPAQVTSEQTAILSENFPRINLLTYRFSLLTNGDELILME